MTKAEIVGNKIFIALRKIDERLMPYIIGYLLRQYKRYGLADLVEMGWNWKPGGE